MLYEVKLEAYSVQFKGLDCQYPKLTKWTRIITIISQYKYFNYILHSLQYYIGQCGVYV